MAESAAYLSAVAALVGTFVGGMTSIATSWLGQQRQTKEQRRARQNAEVQALYKLFIQDASKLYVDAPFSGVRQSINHGFPDPLRAFSEACHEELKRH